jgi:O-antigen chain-terminating methyltransferase
MKALPDIGDQLEDLRRDFEQEQRSVTARLSQADRERLDHGRELEVFRENLPRLERELQVLNSVVADQETRLAQQAARLSLQERLLTRSGDTRVGSEPDPVQVDIPRPHSAPPAELDGLYMVFEDQFRGSREEIRSRLAGYLPQVDECVEAIEGEGLAIDLGCGRGEWLELLGERGVRALGVDNNPGFLAQCEQFGLAVIESDAIEYLASLPDESVSIVSAFHLIEHLEFDVLVRMIDEIQRVLQPGGMVVFETPNPKNLIVGACNFYADPTHVRQVFPELLEFVVQSRGFHSAGIRYLNPHPEEQRLSSAEAPILARELNDLLSCARDFAVIAHK